LPLRFIVGYGFMEHGYAKIARGPEHFAGILAVMGVPGPRLMSWMTILVEFVGGLAVLLGVFIPIIAVPMAAILVVAASTVHLPNGFSSIKLLSVTPSGANPTVEVQGSKIAADCCRMLSMGQLTRRMSDGLSTGT